VCTVWYVMQTCLTTPTTNITQHAPIRPPILFRRPGDFPHSSPFLETHQLILSVPSASVWKKRTILWGHSAIQPKPGNSDTFVTLLYTFVTGSTANLPLFWHGPEQQTIPPQKQERNWPFLQHGVLQCRYFGRDGMPHSFESRHIINHTALSVNLMACFQKSSVATIGHPYTLYWRIKRR